jgi:hypothetical protein
MLLTKAEQVSDDGGDDPDITFGLLAGACDSW